MIGPFSECIVAMRTPAEVAFMPGNFLLDCQVPRFLRQAGRAHDEITDLLQVFLRIGNEYINAPLTAETVFLTLITACCRLVLADLQPYQ